MSKLVLKVCYAEWKNESRDKRELAVCRELGARVLVMAKGDPINGVKKELVDGFDALLCSSWPLGEHAPKAINQAISVFRWAGRIKKIQPDLITGHDLPALLIAWVSNLWNPQKALLVYDSHEFELGRNVQRSWFRKKLIRWCEGFLIKRCALSIMVNDPIADAVQKEYRLKNRPLVVRSTPNLWAVDQAVCAQRRTELLCQMKTPKDTVLMYHGALLKDRGIETLLKLISLNPNVCAVILGNGRPDYQETLRRMVQKNHVEDRVLFHPAVPHETLWEYVGAADIGMMPIQPSSKSYFYSLPNKFFENIQSETPMICPNYPAMAPIVDKYRIGLTCDPTDINAVNECVEKLRTDKALYQQCKANLQIAKKDLCWENEKHILMEAYRKLI